MFYYINYYDGYDHDFDNEVGRREKRAGARVQTHLEPPGTFFFAYFTIVFNNLYTSDTVPMHHHLLKHDHDHLNTSGNNNNVTWCWTVTTTTTTSMSGNSGGSHRNSGKRQEGMTRARDRHISSLVSVCFFFSSFIIK
jgi:hypothetical protein